MQGAQESYSAQREQVFREYHTALETGQTDKAARIKDANPDLNFGTKETEA